jgi:hypothetical protein
MCYIASFSNRSQEYPLSHPLRENQRKNEQFLFLIWIEFQGLPRPLPAISTSIKTLFY